MDGNGLQKESLFNHIINATDFGIYVTDIDHNIIFWNETATTITGYTQEDVLGRKCNDNILEHIDKNGKKLCLSPSCPITQAMQTNSRIRVLNYVFDKTKDNRAIALQVMAAPFHNEDGKVIGAVEFFRDFTQDMKDIALAKSIQKHLVSIIPLVTEGVEIGNRYIPADIIGGDFQYIRQLENNKIITIIADVSGHGISAALITSMIKIIIENSLKNSKTEELTPIDLLQKMEEEYIKINIPEKYFTAFISILDIQKKQFRYANAGHCYPLYFNKKDNTTSFLNLPGKPIGLNFKYDYDEKFLQLGQGDMIFFYTDGVSETKNSTGQLLNVEGIQSFLNMNINLSTEALLNKFNDFLLEFRGTVDVLDDVTFILLKML